ncbi:MAG TPA: P1 family peptidase [Thermoanaerobaculia bacterium]|nr:P1 family peptidase [Thermoanaerobaculia bacterium]
MTHAPAIGADPPARPRLRELGVRPGVLPPGPRNAITDVEGVRVGHATLVRGETVRTGVTAILPHPGNLFQEKVPGAVFVGNGFGKLTGSTQVRELGQIETPILLSSTLNVFRVADALVDWMLALPGNESVTSVNPLVGETNDGRLNDGRSRPVGRDEVFGALRSASGGEVEEGSVGAGTGTVAFGWKGGIGTSSRRLPETLGGWTVGALVQSNFGGVLTIDGLPVGKALGRHVLQGELGGGDGSIMIVLATDAPLDARALERLAARGIMGVARTGAAGSNGSGDYAIAFSTHPALRSRHGETGVRPRPLVPTEGLSPLFLAAIEATEEAVCNSLLRATTVSGNGTTIEAIPIDALRRLIAAREPQPPRGGD